MRESGKKTFKKKNIEPIIGNVYEGDEIKKTLDYFLEKLMRRRNKKNFWFIWKKNLMKAAKKKHIWKKKIISWNKLDFFRMFFYHPKLTGFFRKSAT